MATVQASTSRAKPPVVQPSSGNAIIINPCQRLNPVLECIRNVNKEFGDIVPDFQLGKTTCALYLSLKYHRLHPEYVHQRIERLGHSYNLRILMLLCDISEHQEPIRELTKICLINNITIMIAWSFEEAGICLATYKAFEHKSPELIKERVDNDYDSMMKSALMSISRVNKTDVETLKSSVGSFANIAKASPERLQQLPGFGHVKVRRLKDAFERPFRNKATSKIASLASEALSTEDQSVENPPLATTLSEDALPTSSGSTHIRNANIGRSSNELNGKQKNPFDSTADMFSLAHQALLEPSIPVSAREPSPKWDIELDLNEEEVELALIDAGREESRLESHDVAAADSDSTIDKMPPPPLPRQRSPSPIWDIELDLNDSL